MKFAIGDDEIQMACLSPKDRWTITSIFARARANHRCAACDSELRLVAHHIVSRRSGGGDELTNITVLCAACHVRGHRLADYAPGGARRRRIA